MKRLLIGAVLISVVGLFPAPAFACSTIIVGKDASATGRVIVGHDEDDDEPHLEHGRLALVPPRTHRSGTVLPAEKGCARIPQVARTHGFYWSEVKDTVHGGLRNADLFVNDHGVFVTSNNGVADAPKDADSEVIDGGIGYNLRRAIAERANSARDGVTIATNLLETYGYDMPGRMYTIADAGEAWVVEVVHGRRYVARRCPDNAVTVLANCYTIGNIQSGDILSPAVAKRIKADSTFAFDRAYQGSKRWRQPVDLLRMKHMYRLAAGRDFPDGMPPFSAEPRRRVTAADVKAALATHYEGTPDACLPRHAQPTCDLAVCRPSTIESTICVFGEDVRALELHVAAGSPCANPYRIFKPFGGPLPKESDRSADAIHRLETHLIPEVAAGNPVPIVFDTDMYGDYDDVGALACLHALADEGRCEILATVSSTRGNCSVGAIEAVNAYYGRPQIPVGCPHGTGVSGPRPGETDEAGHAKYRKLVADFAASVRHPDADTAPDAVDVYRRALAAAPDKSVVVCTVGFMTNVRRLLETPGDAISPLAGRELVARKVKAWYAMAAQHPKGREYNVYMDAESAAKAFADWPTPIVWSDWNLGAVIYAGRAVAETDDPRNPVRQIFRENLPSREAVAKTGATKGGFAVGGRAAWDEVTVLAAVCGPDEHFALCRGRYAFDAKTGESTWTDDPESPHARLVERLPAAEVGRILNDLMSKGKKGN